MCHNPASNHNQDQALTCLTFLKAYSVLSERSLVALALVGVGI